MATATQAPLSRDDPNSHLKAHLFAMDCHFKKFASSIGSETMATMLGSINLEESQSDYSYSCSDRHALEDSSYNHEECMAAIHTQALNAMEGHNLPHDLDDFSCTSHSMDFGELLRADEQSQHQQQQQQQETTVEEGFHDSYDLGKALGEGAFGTVHRCYEVGSGKRKQKSYAVKSVPMENFNHEEIEILHDLIDCPSVSQIRDVFFEKEQAFIVMEEMEGGELLDRVSEKGFYNEMEAKLLFLNLMESVLFCHSRGVAHCDIKPENILLKYKDDDTVMQLADFGLAKRFITPDGRRQQLFDMNGSAEYAAPEVFSRPEGDTFGYDERCDIWSLGVVLYILLAGYAPFDGEDAYDTIRKVAKGKFKFHRNYWNNISMEAKILIVRMLQVHPDDRCTIEEALESPWFDDVLDLSQASHGSEEKQPQSPLRKIVCNPSA